MSDRPVIPYGKQHITDEDIEAVNRVLRSDYLTQGPEIVKFEEAFAEYTGARYAVAVSNGTAALHLGALVRSEEHTSELQSRGHLVCRLLLEKKKNKIRHATTTH